MWRPSIAAFVSRVAASSLLICILTMNVGFGDILRLGDADMTTSKTMQTMQPADYAYYHLADFHEGKAIGWRLATDQVMGGLSTGTARLVKSDVGKVAHMTGTVSTANNGGFVQVRKRFGAGEASGYDGVFLQVRGNQESYAVHLRNRQSVRPWMNYRQGFQASEDWTILYLPFADFTASRSGFMPSLIEIDSIYSIGIVAYGGDFTADLQIAQVGFYKTN